MNAKSAGFIAIYDDGDCIISPMGWNEDCDGAIESACPSVALFATRSDARKAIRISTAFARLNEAQQGTANTDFLPPCLKNVKIRPLEARP